MEGKIGVRCGRRVEGVSDLGLDVGEGNEVGGLFTDDEMPHEIPQDLKKEKVDVEFV